MRTKSTWWDQGEVECIVTRWATSRDVALTFGTSNKISLCSGRLALTPLDTLVQPLSAYVCCVCNTGFTNVVCIYVFSLQFLFVGDHCPSAALLKVTAYRIFGPPVLLLPILTSHITVGGAHLLWSIPATRPPHFHLILWATLMMSFVLFLFRISVFVTLSLHTACNILCSTIRWQFWSSFFPFSFSYTLWFLLTGQWNAEFHSRRRPCLLSWAYRLSGRTQLHAVRC
jgi:hypothetical protein